MATRKVMDCVDVNTGEKIYPRTHAKSVVTSDGKTLQEKFDEGEYLDETKANEMYQGKGLTFSNVEASVWVVSATYVDFAYQCDVACVGVTADDFAEVVFDLAESTSGNYAPLCETKDGIVTIWSKVADSITIPTIIITRYDR